MRSAKSDGNYKQGQGQVCCLAGDSIRSAATCRDLFCLATDGFVIDELQQPSRLARIFV